MTLAATPREFKMLPVALIDAPALPSRSSMDETLMDELVANIHANGLIQPISVARVGTRFEVIAGHRRRLACERAGLVVIPGARQAVGGGKTGILYLVDTGKIEKLQDFQAFINEYNPQFVVDSYWAGGPHLHGSPVFWQGPDTTFAYVYHWSENDYLKAFKYSRSTLRLESDDPIIGDLLAAGSADPDQAVMPGGMISLSANGNRDGILWASIPDTGQRDPGWGELRGRLLAIDAVTLKKIWDTPVPTIPKFMPPTVSDGKVFMPTSSNVVFVYGLGPAW